MLNVREEDVLVTRIDPNSSGKLLVSFDIFAPSMSVAVELSGLLRAQVSTRVVSMVRMSFADGTGLRCNAGRGRRQRPAARAVYLG